MDIIQDDKVVGYLKINVEKDGTIKIGENEVAVLSVSILV